MIIFSDIDGCITPKRKIWTEKTEYIRGGEFSLPRTRKWLEVQKQYSDHDSCIIEHIREDLVFISGDDRVNRAWAEYKNVPFIHVPGFKDKWDALHEELTARGLSEFAYLGDALPDFTCLLNAKFAFVPSDASLFLIKKLQKERPSFIKLKRNGGNGALEEIVLFLLDKGLPCGNLKSI